jgi:hypothetical protein
MKMPMFLLTTILSVSVTVIAWIGLPKLYLDTLFASRNRAREDYKFAKEYLNDLHGEKPLHPYLRQKACQVLTGARDVRARDIEYVISLVDPDIALQLYVRGKNYLELEQDVIGPRMTFKEPYRAKSARTRIKAVHFVLYAIPIFSVNLAPRLLDTLDFDGKTRATIGLAWFLVALCTSGYILYRSKRLTFAEKLVKQVDDSTPQREIQTASV